MIRFRNRVAYSRHSGGSILLAALAVLTLLFATHPVFAAPTLEQVNGQELKNSFETSQHVTMVLRYTDPNGDPIKKADAVFKDDSPGGTVAHTATDIDGTDTARGVTITWDVNGFTAGGHTAYFEVKTVTGAVARYPAEASTFYAFSVEAPYLKWIILGIGIVVCLVVLPFLTYLIFRSANPRGDPSRAARGSLFFGFLGILALFSYLFFGFWSTALLIVVAVIAVISAMVMLFGRR